MDFRRKGVSQVMTKALKPRCLLSPPDGLRVRSSTPATAGAHSPPRLLPQHPLHKGWIPPEPANHGVYEQPQTVWRYYTMISKLMPSQYAFPTWSNGLKIPFLPRERKAGSDSDLCASITSCLPATRISTFLRQARRTGHFSLC